MVSLTVKAISISARQYHNILHLLQQHGSVEKPRPVTHWKYYMHETWNATKTALKLGATFAKSRNLTSQILFEQNNNNAHL